MSPLRPVVICAAVGCSIFYGSIMQNVRTSACVAADAQPAETPVVSLPVGVTRQGDSIDAVLMPDMLDVSTGRRRILLVCVDDRPESERAVRAAWDSFQSDTTLSKLRNGTELGIVPRTHLQRTGSPATFPPGGTAYSDPLLAEAHYLWRWIGILGPDLVVCVKSTEGDATGLADALAAGLPSGVGSIPAIEVTATSEADILRRLSAMLESGQLPVSPAAVELRRRQDRTALDVATELSRTYGHQLNSVAYIPALALVGRVRLGELTGDPAHELDVRRIASRWTNAESSLGDNPSGSTLSGHLVFGELAFRSADESAEREAMTRLVRAAADTGFTANGQPRTVMPWHNEMSDAVFMGTPILVQAGRLTGETKYYDMASRHLQFMLDLNVRDDGLHRHSPLDQTAWGRGNGFPALGLALCLTDLPADSTLRPMMLAAFRKHMAAMKPHQDASGMWHQVVDRPESYRELTVTCMTTFAALRGIRNGWLDATEWESAIQRAWIAIKRRIGPDGNLVDVCTGTGKQKSLREYYDRPAILGRDDRGGAMALLVATEFAAWEKQSSGQ